MYKFKAQQIDVLVATDIVARGIAIDDIQLVINFDVPHDAEDYVHRIGRTARANNDGEAITLVSEKDQQRFASIEHFLETEIEKRPLPEGLGEGPAYRPKKKAARKDMADVGIRGRETVIKRRNKNQSKEGQSQRKPARMQIAEEALQIGIRKRNNSKKRKLLIKFSAKSRW